MGIFELIKNIPIVGDLVSDDQQNQDKIEEVKAKEKLRRITDKPYEEFPDFLKEKAKVLHEIFSASPNYQKLSYEAKVRVLRESIFKPETAFELIQQDPYLSKYWEQSSNNAKEGFIAFLSHKPTEQGLKEPYFDPTAYLPIAGIAGKGIKEAAKITGQVFVGGIAGETAKQAYEQLHPEQGEAPWWVGLLGDIASGLPRTVKDLVSAVIKKAKTPDEAVKEIEKLQKTTYNQKEIKALEGVKEKLKALPPPKEKIGYKGEKLAKYIPPREKPIEAQGKVEQPQKPQIEVEEIAGIKFAKDPEIAKEQMNILAQLEGAEAGKRIVVEEGGERKVFSKKSTYPEWIPEHLRKKKLVKSVLEKINKGEIPKGKRQRELYEIIKEKLEEPIKRAEQQMKDEEDLGEWLVFGGGPSTEQVLKAVKRLKEIPQDPLEDPRIPKEFREQEKLERFSSKLNFLKWLAPQYEALKSTPEGAALYRLAQDYTEGLEKDLDYWFGQRLEDITSKLDNLRPKERQKIVDIVEGKAKPETKQERVLAQKIRQFLDDVYKFAKEKGLDIHYRKNYFPHIFEGNIRVEVDGEFISAKNWDEALDIASKALNEGKKVKIKAFLPPDIYELRITNPRFQALLSKLEKGVELTRDEIKEIVKEAGIGRRPRYRYVANLLERKYNIEGYIKDPETALKLYTFNIVKKVHQDRFLKEYEKLIEQIPHSKTRQLFDEYKSLVLGHPTKPEQLLSDAINTILKSRIGRYILHVLGIQKREISPFTVRKGAGVSSYVLNHLFNLGFSISSAFVNTLQTLHNVIPLVGVNKGGLKYVQAVLSKGENKLKKELFKAGILSETGFENLRQPIKLKGVKETIKSVGNIPLLPFQFAELLNRVNTYGLAKEYALKNGVKGMEKVLKLLGVPEHDPLMRKIKDGSVSLEEKAIAFAKEVVDKTQFRYEKFAAPKLLAGSLGKFVLPYKTYLINQMLLSLRMLKNVPKAKREAFLFFAIPILIAGTSGNPVIEIAWKILEELYRQEFNEDLRERIKKEFGKAGEVLLDGVLKAFAGIDIRSSVKLELPTRIEDWLGHPFDWLVKAGRGELKIEELYPRIAKNITEAIDMFRTGLIRDSKGRVIAEATTTDAILRLLGFKPEEYYKFLEAKQKIRELDLIWKDEYEPLFNDLADAIVANDRVAIAKAMREILKKQKELLERFKKSKGIEKKKALYLLLRMRGAMTNIRGRVLNKVMPFRYDRKKYMLMRAYMEQ